MDDPKGHVVEVQRGVVAVSNTPVPFSIRVLSFVAKIGSGLVRRKDFTINRRLADLTEIKVPASSKPVNGISSKDVIVNPKNGVWVRIFTPCNTKQMSSESGNDSQKLPVVVYYHGGGFAVLCPNFVYYDQFCRNLAREKPCIVISVHYRRAPEYKFPTAYDDSFEVLQWLQMEGLNNLPSNADISNCILMGDSAGGNIVHHVGCKAAIENLNEVKIRGHVLLQPFFGGEERTPAEIRLVNAPVLSVECADWYWKAYLPPGSDRSHPACNVFGPHAVDVSQLSLPDILVIAGSLDILQDWQARYVESLKKLGKKVDMLVYDGGVHSFHLFDFQNIAKQLRADICKFMEKQA